MMENVDSSEKAVTQRIRQVSGSWSALPIKMPA